MWAAKVTRRAHFFLWAYLFLRHGSLPRRASPTAVAAAAGRAVAAGEAVLASGTGRLARWNGLFRDPARSVFPYVFWLESNPRGHSHFQYSQVKQGVFVTIQRTFLSKKNNGFQHKNVSLWWNLSALIVKKKADIIIFCSLLVCFMIINIWFIDVFVRWIITPVRSTSVKKSNMNRYELDTCWKLS